MSEEEKKAYERIERQIIIGECDKNLGIPVYLTDIKKIMNLIKKQQKEIDMNYIPKQKILDKIEWIKNTKTDYHGEFEWIDQIEILQELLNEEK